MDMSVWEALRFKDILALLEPCGDAGNSLKHHPMPYKPGQEALLRKDYKRLELLSAVLSSNKKAAEQLHAALAEAPWLPHTLKALQERPLMLHELFEVKKLVHYARLLQKTCKKQELDKIYLFPDLENLYALLDPEQTNSPAFALGAAFDTRLAKYLTRMQDLQQAGRKEELRLLQEARKAEGMNKPLMEIVISRSLVKEVRKLQKSEFYRLAEENFANLTFRLKDSPQLTSIKKQVSSLSAKLTDLEADVLIKLSKKLRTFGKVLQLTAETVATLDWDFAKAVFMAKYGCCLPAVSAKLQFSAKLAVNLPAQLELDKFSRAYQPLDLHFNTPLNVLTGPNMGGKTTALKTVGQFCLLAAYGLPLPAKEAEICLFDQVWFNGEAENGENLSSFGREIVSLAKALEHKGKTLFLFDELARGTNPKEGEAILMAVLQYLAVQPALTIAATHYDKPAHLDKAAQYAIRGIDPKALNKLSNVDKTALDAQLDLLNQLMDYRPVRLSLKIKPPQNALPIASALGLPDIIIKKAAEYINKD